VAASGDTLGLLNTEIPWDLIGIARSNPSGFSSCAQVTMPPLPAPRPWLHELGGWPTLLTLGKGTVATVSAGHEGEAACERRRRAGPPCTTRAGARAPSGHPPPPFCAGKAPEAAGAGRQCATSPRWRVIKSRKRGGRRTRARAGVGIPVFNLSREIGSCGESQATAARASWRW
jgi:hypothetical protein